MQVWRQLGVAAGLLCLAGGVSGRTSEEAAVAAPELPIGLTAPEPLTEPGLYEAALARLNERLQAYPDDLEASLLKSLLFFKAGRMGDAMGELNRLTARAPKFHLAHLIRGDLLLAQAQTVTDIGSAPVLAQLPVRRDGIDGLRGEAEVRLKAYLDTLPRNRVPSVLLSLGDSTEHALVVDKSSHRLYVYERAAPGEPPRLVRDFYVSTGKLIGNKESRGDLRTPDGVYFIKRYIPKEQLADKYGNGAFPTNYPNEYDEHLGKTGDGIWLHGTEAVYYSRPPRDSEGCVVLPNQDLSAVGAYIRPGTTPMVITEQVKWLEREEWVAARDEVLAALDAWRSDWESRDVERYLGHYAPDFWSEGYNLRTWSARKRLIVQGKSYQQVSLSDISAYSYPVSTTDGRDMVVVNFRQDYRSNNLNGLTAKRLYLARQNGGWQVLYEGQQ
jgi:murein L,D-transpeptidase YafK